MATKRLILAVALLGGLFASGSATASGGQLSLLKTARVEGEVTGDVVAVGGNVVLGSHAVVHGHAVAVLGSVTLAPGARLDGRAVAIRSLAGLAIDPSLERELPLLPFSLRLLAAGGWLLATTFLAFSSPHRLRSTARVVPVWSVQVLVLGALAAVTLFAALVAVFGLGPTFGVPLAAALLLLFLLAKVVGLAVIGGAVGTRLVGRLTHRLMPLTFDVFAGMVLLLLLRFVPLLGPAAWCVVSVAAFGIGVVALVQAAEQGMLVLPAAGSRRSSG